MNKLNSKIIFSGKIKLLTGTHIGGTNSSMGIGGPDSNIIRNPIDNKPYIPGSSIKGKMRSLLELADGKTDLHSKTIENGPSKDSTYIGTILFGNSNQDKTQQPSRIIIRDANLSSNDDIFKNTDLPYSESKTEVVIDRITAAAMPRQIERIPAGAEFELNMVVNIFDSDKVNELLQTTFRALKLVKDDYIGGNGSRGYGQVAFNIDSIKERPVDFYLTNSGENDITEKYREDIDLLKE